MKFYASLGNHDDPTQRFYKNFNMNGERFYTFKKDHVRFFTRRSFERLATGTGFRVVHRSGTGLPLEVLDRGANGPGPGSGSAGCRSGCSS